MKRFPLFLLLLVIVGLIACNLPNSPLALFPRKATPTPTPLTPVLTPAPIATPKLETTPPAADLPTLPSIADIVEKVKPAVVAITTETLFNIFLQPVPMQGAGTGMVFTPDGYILTNNHVIEEARKIMVTFPKSDYFPNGASIPARLIGRDPRSDLAVIKVEGENLPTVTFGDSTKLRVGDWVIAIGNAQALPGGPTVSLGIVSALDRSIFIPEKKITLYGLIQTDAAINPGNSGGPLINLKGEVIGINTAIIAGAENIGFAIASATALPIKDELLRYGRVRWPWLGVSITTLTPTLASEIGTSATQGVLILQVRRGNPAERAGLRAGDVIIKLDKTPTPDLQTFQKALRNYRAGDRVEITIIRKDRTLKITVVLGEMPSY